jgi:hypothetical protein
MSGETREPCPRCRAQGKDQSGDNLVRWPDGHAHCFACGRHEFVDWKPSLPRPKSPPITLPSDAGFSIDMVALTWLSKYEIEMEEVTKYGFLWSAQNRWLIYPMYGENKLLLAWQARVFNSKWKSKYYTVGPVIDILNILNLTNGSGDDIILVEDFVSAIKIARHCTSMPLLGSSINMTQLNRLKNVTEHLTFWLDNDKVDRALELCRMAEQLGFHTKMVCTKHDPKEYNDEEIRGVLDV